MGRKRLQQKGELRVQGGQWKLRWREDQIDGQGVLTRGWSRLVTIGPASGRDHLTEKQARRIAWDYYLSKLDQNNSVPFSVVTVDQFVAKRFLPGHVDMLKPNTRTQYRSLLKNHIVPALGAKRLRDVGAPEVQELLAVMRNAGLSPKTLRNANVVVSALQLRGADGQFFGSKSCCTRHASRMCSCAASPHTDSRRTREDYALVGLAFVSPFRRAHATMADQLAMAMSDRIAMMGHARGAMTLHYTAGDLERRAAVVEQMAQRIFRGPQRLQ